MKEYNFNDIADYMASKGVCTRDDAYKYLEAEDDYYDVVGLNVYDLDDIEPSQAVTSTYIDQRDVDKFIVKQTGLPAEIVDRMTEALYEYMEKNGF